MTPAKAIAAGLLALGVLAGCDREVPLPGERLDLRAPLDGSATEDAADPGLVAFNAPPAQRAAEWPFRMGTMSKAPVHQALSSTPERIWSARIGQGDGKRHRITADPIVANGRIFTLDSRATVTAVSTGGEVLWSRDLTPATERTDDGSGGGLASDGGRVYVTSGFGRLTALDAATGAEIWVQRLGAAATSAPVVRDGVVYAVGLDSRGWAIDADTGRIVWETNGIQSYSGILGGAAPTVTDRLVILPFTSGELVAVLRQSGLRVWTVANSSGRLGRVYAEISDVSGDPVVVGNTVYAGNPGGRSVALDLTSGERLWTADEGAMSPIWVAGGSLFQISDQNELLRLDAATGERIWGTQLPYFENRRPKRYRAIYDHYGPVLAGERLMVLSGDGFIRSFDPTTGTPLGDIPLPGGATSLPAFAGGVMYVVTANGQLHAFR